jgi:hypothetical protein
MHGSWLHIYKLLLQIKFKSAARNSLLATCVGRSDLPKILGGKLHGPSLSETHTERVRGSHS